MTGKKKVVRARREVVPWLKALVYAMTAFAFAQASAFYPNLAAVGIGVATGVLALVAPALGIVGIILLVALPLMAADLVAGAVFLVLALASLQYLSGSKGSVFVVIIASFLAVRMGAPWAAVVVGGYVLGSAEGAVAAAIACFALELAGIVLGQEAFGAVFAGGGEATRLLHLSKTVTDALSFGWIPAAVRDLDPTHFITRITAVKGAPMLVAQPLVWALAAGIAGWLRRGVEDKLRVPFSLGAGVGASLLAGMGTFAAGQALGGGSADTVAPAVALSAIAAAVVLLVWELVFAPRLVEVADRMSGVETDDADVDELLRMIASAEDALANRHTTDCIVMITDMKSFSKMTEEQGSVLTAKMIQRHRDLLLPVMRKHGGNGKSTGGDGLLAAFASCDDAVEASVEMQQTLDAFNKSGRAGQEMLIRIGIASGEVVLDKGGKPFIGDGLNLAARVMSLADGGQVFVTKEVLEKGTREHVSSHLGEYGLKNISKPVSVYEVLWDEGQEPRAPEMEQAG